MPPAEERLRPDGVITRRRERSGRRRRPADVPTPTSDQAPISRETDAPVAVGRFAGLANRLVSAAIPLALATMAILGLLLAVVGYRTLLGSSGGTSTDASSVRSAPFTETTLMAWVDEGDLSSAALLGLDLSSTDDGPSTSVMVFSADSQLTASGAPLRDIWATGGAEGIADAVAGQLNVKIDRRFALAGEGLAQIASATPPISIVLPESLTSRGESGSLQVAYLEGAVDVSPTDFAEVAGWLNPEGVAGGDARDDRFDRQVALWNGLAAAVAEDGSGLENLAVFGSAADDEALRRTLVGLAGPDSRVEAAPHRPGRSTNSIPTAILDDVAAVTQSHLIIPFPRSLDGASRARVRLLDGGDDSFVTADIRAAVVAAGAEIVTVGEIPQDGSQRSRVVFHEDGAGERPVTDADLAAMGEDLAALVGADGVERSEVGAASFDFTVVVGAVDVEVSGQ